MVSQQTADQAAADAPAKKAIMDAAQANVQQLEAMESFKHIVAPFDGIVTAAQHRCRRADQCRQFGPAELFEVSDLHKVRIYVQVPQAFSADLRPGLKATFEMPQYPGQQFDATVVTIVERDGSWRRAACRSNCRPTMRTASCRRRLLPGPFPAPGDPNMVRVPATALMPADRGAQVAILGDDDKVGAEVRPARPGSSATASR